MAKPGERPDIETKIRPIADRIIRARLAKKNRAILLARVRNVAAVTASALTTIGLSNPLFSLVSGKEDQTLNQAFSVAWFGLPKLFSIVGVVIFFFTALALTYYKQAKVEEKAIQSLGLIDAFETVETNLQSGLEQPEPTQQLNVVYNSAVALETTNSKVMPKRNGHRPLVDEYVKQSIQDYCQYWNSSPPSGERREKDNG